MSKEKTLIPELRFPEFEKDGEWKLEPFNEVYVFKVTNSFSRNNLNYQVGSVKNIHYGDIHTKFSTLFDITKEEVPFINPDISIEGIDPDNYCSEGDIIFADASEDIDDIGKSIEILDLNNEQLLSGLHTLQARQLKPKLIIGFGGHLFKSDSIRKQIRRESQGAKVLGISKGRISDINIFYPDEKNEQQKIADCLSSLDELITAHNEKLEALKDHKKGLLQNLFPQEGQTMPKVRFPEFENDGEWELKKIEDVFDSFSGGTPKSTEKIFYGGKIPFIRSAEISKKFTELYLTDKGLKNSSAKLVNKGDLLVALYGANSGEVAISKIDGAINQAILCLRSDYSNSFTYQFLFSRKAWIVSKYVQGGQGNLSGEILKSIELSYPKKAEQLKIASFLSFIDELISEQIKKIEQLEQHKKGLMQGLFPKVED